MPTEYRFVGGCKLTKKKRFPKQVLLPYRSLACVRRKDLFRKFNSTDWLFKANIDFVACFLSINCKSFSKNQIIIHNNIGFAEKLRRSLLCIIPIFIWGTKNVRSVATRWRDLQSVPLNRSTDCKSALAASCISNQFTK